eukprot:15996223-Heterocapsa_arctica.AAC.1
MPRSPHHHGIAPSGCACIFNGIAPSGSASYRFAQTCFESLRANNTCLITLAQLSLSVAASAQGRAL